jgi:hypothetical protein
MTVIPLRKGQPPPSGTPPRKLTVSRIEGHREWSVGGPYEMIASSDGSVELIGHRKTLVVDGDLLVWTFERSMKPWTEGGLSARWVYGNADGSDPSVVGMAKHWLWLDIAIGEKVYPPTNPRLAGQTYIDTHHIVLAGSSASYHGKKLREALAKLRGK